MDIYDKNEIERQLADKVSEVVIYDKIPSTSTFARVEEVGTLVISSEQSEGRGRSGNGFLSKKGGAYFSLVLPRDVSDGVMLTLASAAAVAQAVQDVVRNPDEVKIKWVNDVYLHGKKLAGILTERLSDKIIIGIGVNFYPVDFGELSGSAISLFSTKKATITRAELIVSIVKKLFGFIDGTTEFLDYYRRNSMVLGKEISYVKDGVSLSGRVIEIDANGHLLLEDGSELLGGEISVRVF